MDSRTRLAILEVQLSTIKYIVLSNGHASDYVSQMIAQVLNVDDKLEDRKEKVMK